MQEILFQWTLQAIQHPLGYVGLFFFNLLSNTILPGSPEAIALAVWKLGTPVTISIIVMTLGNYAGNALNYWIGYAGKDILLKKYFRIKQERIVRAQHLFEKYGPPILLFSWVPVIGDPLTFVPGFLRYNFIKFSIYVLIGKLFRYVTLYIIFSGWL